jgi:hypothetical protein
LAPLPLFPLVAILPPVHSPAVLLSMALLLLLALLL